MRSTVRVVLGTIALFGVACHTITEVQPNPAEAGAEITIAGDGFGARQGSGRVLCDGEELAVLSWSNATNVATLPAEKRGGTYELTVSTRSSSEVASIAHTLLGSAVGMVLVPEGGFVMGGDGVGGGSSLPRHGVLLDAFYIDRTEVTAGAYQACVDDGACVLSGIAPTVCNGLIPGHEQYGADCVK